MKNENVISRLRLRFLGGISVEQTDKEQSNQLPSKALALLCYLAETGIDQPRDALASLLWSDFPEQRARSNLRDTLTLLRRTHLAPHLKINRRQIAMNEELLYWLDTAEFKKNVVGQIGETIAEPAPIEAAVDLYQGDFLEGFQISKAALFEEWVIVQRQHYHLLAIGALQRLVEFHLEEGSWDAGISHACRLFALDPLNEKNHRNLMLLFLRTGDYTAALMRYEQCRQILHDELGIAPSRETQILFQNILSHVDIQDTNDGIRVPSDDTSKIGPVPHNLPGQATPFFGREREQRAIDNVLSDRTGRMVTITGVGGAGKTRLAMSVGEKQILRIDRDGSFRFLDGVFFVPLEAVESPGEIVPAIYRALGFQPSDETRTGRSIEEQLLDYLHRKRLLLIIDNFEHLLAGVGLLVKIHRSTSDVHLLVTSRQKLGLQAERLFALQGLCYPGADEQVTHSDHLLANYSAAALFTASARRLDPDFQINDEEVCLLIRLCRLVDGLPLAIELAAGWTNVLSLADIVAEIEHKLSFLKSNLNDLPDRHRNMDAVFEVSWRRLNQTEQNVFQQLCVFRGGFTRLAASKVVGTSLPQLAALVNKGLIQFDKKTDRYQIHRLLRLFGAEKLARDPAYEKAVRDRHCIYFSALLRQWDSKLKGPEQLTALVTFDRESANALLSWNYALETGNFAAIAQAVNGLGRLYLWRRRFHEGGMAYSCAADILLSTLASKKSYEDETGVKRTLAQVQIWQSVFCGHGRAKKLVGRAIRILDSLEDAAVDVREERAFGLQRAGELAFDSESDEARQLLNHSLGLYRELGDFWGIAKVLTELGWEAAHIGDMEDALLLGEEALDLVREIEDRKQTADVLWLLGTLAILRGKIEEASSLLGESLDIREKLGDRITDIASGPLDLGMTLTWIGRMAEANAVREETLALYEAQGQPEQIALAHVRLVASKFHIGEFDAMERHALIGLELCRKLGNQRGVGLALWHLATMALITGAFDRARSLLQESLDSFQKVNGAIEVGWVFGMFAELARRECKFVEAKRYLYNGLITASGLLGMITYLGAIGVYMNLLIDDGHLYRGVEMHALLEKHPFAAKSLGLQRLYSARLAEIKTILPPGEIAKAKASGRLRDVRETAGEILAELETDVRA